MTSISLKTIGPEAVNTLQSIWINTFKEAYAGLHSEADIQSYCDINYSEEAAQAVLMDELSDCILAYVDGNPVGFYVVKHHNCPLGNFAEQSSELKQIYILADHYGDGVGRALYSDALKKISARNRSAIWLLVSDLNSRAQAFYKKQGFEYLGPGPVLEVGAEKLPSSVLGRAIEVKV
ncbi:MAG: GNAT family N-acetyltransferase [Kordiimonas sp.]